MSDNDDNNGQVQTPSPMAFACFYLFTNLVERLMARGLLVPEDLRTICAQAAGAAADAALALADATEDNRALRMALEEAGQIAATMFRAEP